MPGGNIPADNTREKPIVINALPLPDYGEGGGFESVMQHLNPSSHIDNVCNQLTKHSTLVGSCNLSTAKSQVIIMSQAVVLQSGIGPVG